MVRSGDTAESTTTTVATTPGDTESAVARVPYTRNDGSSTTETNTLHFVNGDGGTLLIDSSS